MSIERRDLLKVGALGGAVGAALLTSGMGAAAQDDSVFDVAVIGAGFSGLSAARILAKAGVKKLVVIEARDRVGGRVYNQTIDKSYPAPAGGTWVGPGQWAVIDLAQELGVPLRPQYNTGDTFVLVGDQVQRVPTTASPITNEAFIAKLDELAQTVSVDAPWAAPNAAKWDAMTYADYLDTSELSPEDRGALNVLTLLTYGAPPEALSFLHVLFYIHSAGGVSRLEATEGGAQESRIVGGSQILALKMAEELGDTVRLSTPVKSVRNWKGSDVVEIETAKGVVNARQVIMALSPSQAAEISFIPALPAGKAGLISAWPTAGSGTKTYLSYEKPFWRTQGHSGNIYSFDCKPFAWAADASPADSSIGLLTTLTLSGDGLSPGARKAATLEIFAKCFGGEALKPTDYVQFDWATEAYTRGCVSPLKTGILTKYGSAIRTATGSLIWAGTETSIQWMGYMDGAVRAGRRAAAETLAALAASH